MRTWVAGVLLLAGCSGTGAGSSDAPEGCYTAESAFSAFDDVRDGFADQTVTEADAAAAMKKINDKLSDAASIASDPVKSHFAAAAVSAGRIRVALSGGVGDVSGEVETLKTEIFAAADICHA